MVPCPVAGHEVAVLPLFAIEFAVCHIIDMPFVVFTSKDTLDDFTGVSRRWTRNEKDAVRGDHANGNWGGTQGSTDATEGHDSRQQVMCGGVDGSIARSIWDGMLDRICRQNCLKEYVTPDLTAQVG